MPDVPDLSTLSVRPIRGDERDRWQRMMTEKHYLQSNRMVGEQIRYVAVDANGIALSTHFLHDFPSIGMQWFSRS